MLQNNLLTMDTLWNPGMLPMGWTIEKLKQLHTSIPAKPLMAESMYLAGYIERLGSCTSDMVRIATIAGLKEPEFIQADDLKQYFIEWEPCKIPCKAT